MKTEIWKDIKGYEGLYQVSNLGRVKSLRKIGKNHNNKEHILKPANRKGYLQLHLVLDGVQHTYSIHRLVADAFIPNPDKLPEVNHKDENKQNNKVENLEWCSHLYNINYGTRTQKCSKSVIQYKKDGTFVLEFKSIKEAERKTGIWFNSICCCCNHKRKSAGGYVWRFKQ